MAKLYTTVETDRSVYTHTSTEEIKAALQSYEGSLITKMMYTGKEPIISIRYSTTSASHGSELFCGTLPDLITKLQQ